MWATYSGSLKMRLCSFSATEEHMKLKITLTSNNEGWNTAVNGKLLLELAGNPRVKVSGLVPRSTDKQRTHARSLGIELFDAKDVPAVDNSADLLAYPPDSLDIDVLIIHSFGRKLGRQAQVIKEIKKCKWVHVLHTVSEELVKIPENAKEHQSEHETQVALCQKADLVIAIGPKVADAYRSALYPYGQDKKVIDLTPGLFHNFIGVRPSEQEREKFHVLISGSLKYFKVKGCDIAARAITLLNTQSSLYHLTFVVKPSEDVSEITQCLLAEGLDPCQATVKVLESTDGWISLLCEVDLAIKPSRMEGFGMSGLRAISANLPLLASENTGLGMALKKLPFGNKCVVNSDDPGAWAEEIKRVHETDLQTRRLEAEELRKQYMKQFNWKEQCNNLVSRMVTMISTKSDD